MNTLWLPTNLLLLAHLTSISNALYYYIDNTNNTIRYQPSTGHNWYVSNLLPDYSRCFDGTAIYNECMTENDCHITIPFTGSGIAIHVVQLGSRGGTIGLATNVSITLDTAPPTVRTLSPSTIVQYNITLYDVEGVPWGDHTLDIALVSMVYPGQTVPSATEMTFDYAVVNETPSSFATTSASTSTSTSTPISTMSSVSSSPTNLPSVSPKNRNNSGAIAGGVVGGILGLLVIAFTLVRRRRRREVKIDSERKVNPFDPTYDEGSEPVPHALSYLTDSSFSSTPDAEQARTATRHSHHSVVDTRAEIRQAFPRSRTPSAATQSTYRLSGIKAAMRQDIPASPTASMSTAPSVTKRGRFMINSSLWDASGSSEQSRPSSTVTPVEPIPIPLPPELSNSLRELPEEQAEFVRGLLGVNVPMAEIVRVVDIMKEGRKEEGEGDRAPVGGTTDMPNSSPRTLYQDI